MRAAGALTGLTYAGRSPRPPDHPLFRSATGPDSPPSPTTFVAGYGQAAAPPPESTPSIILIAVPDDAISAVAAELATATIPSRPPVLHLSGALGAEVLAPLADLGHPAGSLHPLAALPDADAAARLRGGWFAVEGAGDAARAARAIVAALDGHVLQVQPGGKPMYHAAAVAASNYVVALMGVAERWMGAAGVPPTEARAALAALAAGAVNSVARLGPAAALTGPVARGDAGTISSHLARLSGPDRHVYSVLAGTALSLARQRGLDPAAADEIARLLESTE